MNLARKMEVERLKASFRPREGCEMNLYTFFIRPVHVGFPSP